MAYIFGISSHSPDQVLAFLLKRKAIDDMSKVAIVPFGTCLKVNTKPVRNILFVISTSDLYRNLEVINSKHYANTQIFVFASPLRINELQNVTPLDYEDNPASPGVAFLLKKEISQVGYARALKKPVAHVSRMEVKYLTLLTNSAKQGSLLNPLMTFIYTLPGASTQTHVKEAVATYISRGISFDKLQTLFDGLNDGTISKKHRERMRQILVSEIGDNYRAAFAYMREAAKSDKAPSLASVCKKHGTSEYEIRYIKSIVESKTKNKPIVGKPLTATPQVAA